MGGCIIKASYTQNAVFSASHCMMGIPTLGTKGSRNLEDGKR
jgi:hypothetical protein